MITYESCNPTGNITLAQCLSIKTTLANTQ